MPKSIKYGPAAIAAPAERIVFVPYQHPAAAALAGVKLGRACPRCNATAARLYSRLPIVAVECLHASSPSAKQSAPIPPLQSDNAQTAKAANDKKAQAAETQSDNDKEAPPANDTKEQTSAPLPTSSVQEPAPQAAAPSTSSIQQPAPQAAAEKQAPSVFCLPNLPLVQDQLYAFFDMNLRYSAFTDEALLYGLARIDANMQDLALAMRSASMPLLPMCTPPLYLVLMSPLAISRGISQYAFTTSARLFATYGLVIGLIFHHLSHRATMLAEHMLLFEEAEQLTTLDGVYDEQEEQRFRAQVAETQATIEQSAAWTMLQAMKEKEGENGAYWSALLGLKERAGLTQLHADRAEQRADERAAWRKKNAAAEAALRLLKEKKAPADEAQRVVDGQVAELQQAKMRYMSELQAALKALPDFAYKETAALFAQIKRSKQLQDEYADAVCSMKKTAQDLWRATEDAGARAKLMRTYCYKMLNAQELLLCKLMGISAARLAVLGSRYDGTLEQTEDIVVVTDALGKLLGKTIAAAAAAELKKTGDTDDAVDDLSKLSWWRKKHPFCMLKVQADAIVDARSFNALFIAPTMAETEAEETTKKDSA